MSTDLHKKARIFSASFVEEEINPSSIIIPEARRGDILLDSEEWSITEDDTGQHIDGGYRHHGILIYDGTKFIDLEDKYNDYGTIPDEFSIVEFPATYWSHVLNYDSHVPFDVERHLGTLDKKHLQSLNSSTGIGYHLVYPFVNLDGRIYGIVDVEQQFTNNPQGFIDAIQNETHFNTLIDGDIQDGLPSDWNYETLLLYGKDIL
jgi:hypothetical protein